MLETPESRNYKQYFRFGRDHLLLLLADLFAYKNLYITELMM